MPFIPIADAGVPFQFGSTGGPAMVGSVISATNADNPSFDLTLTLNPSANFRVTPLNYLLIGTPVTVATFYTVDGGDSLQTPNVGGAAAFLPSPIIMQSFIESGEAYLSFVGANAAGALQETFAFLAEVWVDDAPGDQCEEFGQVTRSYVSGYNRSRVHLGTLYAPETRCLVADFNGALPKSRTIVSAVWQTWQGWVAIMSNPRVIEDGRAVSILLRAQMPGPFIMRCAATLDNGEVYVQQFRIQVLCAPLYNTSGWINGPSEVRTP